jgi:arsenite/tail-anchored protein-transporting ATPase
MDLVRLATRHLFFTGKGGVGKTSVACATAVGLADAGKRVLLVSTDPASNLDEVLGTPLGTRPTVVPGAPRLSALNLDPEAAAHAYRERVAGPYRDLLPAAAVRSMEEQLSGACTVEIAAFDEFARLLGDPAATAEFDHVLFDTAPTGHTLRLLTLPSAWAPHPPLRVGGGETRRDRWGRPDHRTCVRAHDRRPSQVQEESRRRGVSRTGAGKGPIRRVGSAEAHLESGESVPATSARPVRS